ncbi:NAD-dependent epimerase/dehydratase family protein [Dactylosporangium sp. CS-033363]|uniref:NAD-dependent epimerase/dehydratase family protein n=1 Tax=Dactylosporangium sp. CS-033363 TaxID=3239935 RepID=UPI003D8D7CCA
MGETVLVTGGTGYVAGWCVVALREHGYDVRATVRGTPKDGQVQADLLSDDGWDAAMAGVDYVLHVASPLGGRADLITPAREGTLRVLRAAVRHGVRRVVMTSAANAASPTSYKEDSVTDETLWTVDSPKLPQYRRSKTLAELAAWEYMAGRETEFATVLPGAVLGPVLDAHTLGSTQIVARMLRGDMPGAPRIGLEVVDVRDLADLHIRAMREPAASGERFLGTGEFIWMRDIARILGVSTRQLPDLVVRVASIWDKPLRDITISLGRRNRHTTAKAERVLGWASRPVAETVADCARSLREHGVVQSV